MKCLIESIKSFANRTYIFWFKTQINEELMNEYKQKYIQLYTRF